MLQVQRAEQRYRGGDPAAGIDTRHAFSFAGFYDPDNIRLGPLVACNEERLEPGSGFGEHPHRDLEIVTWVVEGELIHEDSAGRREILRAGDVQRLTAGSGVRHAERNASEREPLRFVQMWLEPARHGGAPAYEVVRGISDATPYALPRTPAVLHVRRLTAGQRAGLPRADWCYTHVVRGAVRLSVEQSGAGSSAELLTPGDAARITAPAGRAPTGAADVLATAVDGPAELLVWEMHTRP